MLVPAHQALYSAMDKNLEHFRRYDLAPLRRMVEELGFRVVEERHLNMLGAVGWFVNGRVLRRQLLPSRQLRIFDFVIKLLALEKYVRPRFGLSILLVAEKPAEAARLESPSAAARPAVPQHAR